LRVFFIFWVIDVLFSFAFQIFLVLSEQFGYVLDVPYSIQTREKILLQMSQVFFILGFVQFYLQLIFE
jgi:hypothetical protein